MGDYDVFMIYLVNDQGDIVWSFQPMCEYDNLYSLRGITCKDVDGDGISEIICKQYSYYSYHNDYAGTACSVLKFNNQTQAFEVIDAWYEPNTEG